MNRELRKKIEDQNHTISELGNKGTKRNLTNISKNIKERLELIIINKEENSQRY